MAGHLCLTGFQRVKAVPDSGLTVLFQARGVVVCDCTQGLGFSRNNPIVGVASVGPGLALSRGGCERADGKATHASRFVRRRGPCLCGRDRRQVDADAEPDHPGSVLCVGTIALRAEYAGWPPVKREGARVGPNG